MREKTQWFPGWFTATRTAYCSSFRTSAPPIAAIAPAPAWWATVPCTPAAAGLDHGVARRQQRGVAVNTHRGIGPVTAGGAHEVDRVAGLAGLGMGLVLGPGHVGVGPGIEAGVLPVEEAVGGVTARAGAALALVDGQPKVTCALPATSTTRC